VPASSLIAPEPRREGLPVKYLFAEAARSDDPVVDSVLHDLLMIYFIVVAARIAAAGCNCRSAGSRHSMFSLAGIIGPWRRRLMNRYAPTRYGDEFSVSTL